MLEAMDKKHVTALILLGLSKAFDSINHTILLHKLKCVGASPLAIQWLMMMMMMILLIHL
jgi:hypothetical protein